MKKTQLDDVVAVITMGGLVICAQCADNKDFASVISEDDLILRGSIGSDSDITCDKCGNPVEE